MPTLTGRMEARKVAAPIIEPIKQGYSEKWESFCTTNPTALRLAADPERVFLGYRAAGSDNQYFRGDSEIWGSSLGMAILDRTGAEVLHRFPLPIVKLEPEIPLPQSKEEFDRCLEQHPDTLLAYHDFRLFEHKNKVYLLYHADAPRLVYDCVVRMPVQKFLDRMDRSIEMMGLPAEEILPEWKALWWEEGVWENAGVDGTERVYSGDITKGDIVFFELADGSLQMCHRPVPDIAVLPPSSGSFAPTTPDGFAQLGVLETSIRPGMRDNSHIGNNGNPTLAYIGEVPVYIDVAHGCWNRAVADDSVEHQSILYYPYLRIKDAASGDILYYSEDPLLDFDEIWREYAEEGAWVSRLDHLEGVMFAGGQIEMEPGKNTEDDLFSFYTGIGDTATARAEFRIRDLVPEEVLQDICARESHEHARVEAPSENPYRFPDEISGWQWTLRNDSATRSLGIRRLLQKNGYVEEAEAKVLGRPGYFDADGVIFDGKSVRHVAGLGWLVLYKGVRWSGNGDADQRSCVGFGLLLLDEELPERVLYRSAEPLEGMIQERDGWTLADDIVVPEPFVSRMESLLPEKVAFEVRRMNEMIARGIAFGSAMKKWLLEKSNFWENHTYDSSNKTVCER